MLKYSIDNGQTFFFNLGQFQNLAPGNYRIKVIVSDTTQPCQKVYEFNPVLVTESAGPQVISVITHYETGGHGDGSITIQATSVTDTIYYQVGSTIQVNNGSFMNLHSGTYTCIVSDKFGCDTTFTAVVNNMAPERLQAIAGDGSSCLGNVAVVPVIANNFSKVGSFNIRLRYDASKVICQNYLNPSASLADSLAVYLYPATGEVELKWKKRNPVSLGDGTRIVELSFGSIASGQTPVSWDLSPGISVFLDSLGGLLPTEFVPGRLRIYSIPEAVVPDPPPVCEGGDLHLTSNIIPGTGNGTIIYQWMGPGGFSCNTKDTVLYSVTILSAGIYKFIVSDTNHCQSDYSVTVNVIPTPFSGFTADTVYFDEQTILEVQKGYDRYQWSTGDNSNSIVVYAEGWYWVTMTTAEGCSATDSVMMLYSFVPLTMPNAFSPNGDGLNDVFRPVTIMEKVTSFSMLIFDRWGQQVFYTTDLTNGWDGRINGAAQQTGEYVYLVRYGNPSGVIREKKGTFTLVL